MVLLAALGVARTWRQERVGTVVLGWIVAGSAGYVLVYDVAGSAADLLGVLLAGAVWGAVGATWLAERLGTWGRRGVAAGVLVALVVATGVLARGRSTAALDADATRWLRAAELDALPAGATLLTTWHHAAPLRYALQVRGARGDVAVVSADRASWPALLGGLLDGGRGPVLVAEGDGSPEGYCVAPGGHWGQVRRIGSGAAP
jgi:hypothetical protein